MIFPARAVTKVVPFKFHGVDLSLKVSHALFSSHKVDEGTLLLLKTLVQQKAVPDQGRLLDVGSGTGPLAVALKRRFPGLEVQAQDRLALACAFTEENARFNGVEVKASPALMLDQVPGPWDLLVCNIPAKAGAPVLEDFFPRSAGLLTDQGRAAVVIVNTLAPQALETLERHQIPLIYQEASRQHTVFHYGRQASVPPADLFPGVYLRTSVPWTAGKRLGGLDTFWGLPNFDTVDYRTLVSQPLWEKHRWTPGPLFLWETGQGHTAVALAEVCKPGENLTVGSADILSLRACQHNLGLWGHEGVLAHCLPDFAQIAEAGYREHFQNLSIALHTEPEIPWVEETLAALKVIARPGAHILLNGTSTEVTRLLDRHKGFRILADHRYRGWRAVILERLA